MCDRSPHRFLFPVIFFSIRLRTEGKISPALIFLSLASSHKLACKAST